jgi:hypothetical protein
MLWIFNKKLINDTFVFYQIFIPNKIYKDNEISGNIICNLENNLITPDLSKYKNIKLNYEIKIMGNIISYRNINSSEVLTFTKKESHDLSDNLILTYEYKLVDNHRLPELTSYDFHYNDIEFNIYYNIENELFILQNNKSNNSSTNYWIKQSLN